MDCRRLLFLLFLFIQFLINPDVIYSNELATNFSILDVNDKKNIALLITIFLYCKYFMFNSRFNLWVTGRFAAGLGTDISFECYKNYLSAISISYPNQYK